MAPIVATLEKCNIVNSLNARGSEPLVGKSPLVVSPQNKFIESSDSSALVACSDDGILKAGSGECLPELPEGGLPVAATDHKVDLEVEDVSPTVEKRFGNQADTTYKNTAQRMKGQIKIQDPDVISCEKRKIQEREPKCWGMCQYMLLICC
jgi:hypothetical protein